MNNPCVIGEVELVALNKLFEKKKNFLNKNKSTSQNFLFSEKADKEHKNFA